MTNFCRAVFTWFIGAVVFSATVIVILSLPHGNTAALKAVGCVANQLQVRK